MERLTCSVRLKVLRVFEVEAGSGICSSDKLFLRLGRGDSDSCGHRGAMAAQSLAFCPA